MMMMNVTLTASIEDCDIHTQAASEPDPESDDNTLAQIITDVDTNVMSRLQSLTTNARICRTIINIFIFFYRNGKMIVVGSATKGQLILLDIIKIIVIIISLFLRCCAW